jgi:SSS family solute:Na+ symporter
VILVALVVVWFSIGGSGTLVSLLLMAYSFVTQLFPSLLMSLARRNFVTKQGAIAGVCVGIATVAAINLSHMTLAQLLPGLPEVLHEVNIGIVALVLNVTAMLLVSAATRVVPVRSAVPGVRG